MECNKEKNMERCNCSYEPCSRKGVCCECIQYHAPDAPSCRPCVFPDDAERTYDRSYGAFCTTGHRGAGIAAPAPARAAIPPLQEHSAGKENENTCHSWPP